MRSTDQAVGKLRFFTNIDDEFTIPDERLDQAFSVQNGLFMRSYYK